MSGNANELAPFCETQFGRLDPEDPLSASRFLGMGGQPLIAGHMLPVAQIPSSKWELSPALFGYRA